MQYVVYQWIEGNTRSAVRFHKILSVVLNDVVSLQWRHDERDSVSNQRPHDCLFNCLFRRRSKKTSKLRVTGLCAGNSPVTGEFPTQRASNAESVSIWSRHHVHGQHQIEKYILLTLWETWTITYAYGWTSNLMGNINAVRVVIAAKQQYTFRKATFFAWNITRHCNEYLCKLPRRNLALFVSKFVNVFERHGCKPASFSA